MAKFSVVIITLNEEKKIGKCIDAAFQISDDIIVIDSFSTDNTKKIATEKGAKVFLKKWEGYSAAKNFGAEECSNDWIVSIDADEFISNKLAKSINELEPVTNTVYLVNVFGNFLGKWVKYSGWHPSWKKRIYNKKNFNWDKSVVHEKLTGDIDFNLLKIEGDLYHYSYDTIKDVNEKTERYSKLLAKEMLENGKKIGLLKQVFGPLYKFINTYIFKLGVLDGITGYKISKMNSEVVRKKILYYRDFKKKDNKITF